MFDIAFSEMLVIAVIALIVIGPERLPGVARTLGHLFGRMQRYVNDVKSDIQREVELDELRKLRQSVEESARSIEESVTQEVGQAQQILRDLEAAENPPPEPARRDDTAPAVDDPTRAGAASTRPPAQAGADRSPV